MVIGKVGYGAAEIWQSGARPLDICPGQTNQKDLPHSLYLDEHLLDAHFTDNHYQIIRWLNYLSILLSIPTPDRLGTLREAEQWPNQIITLTGINAAWNCSFKPYLGLQYLFT